MHLRPGDVVTPICNLELTCGLGPGTDPNAEITYGDVVIVITTQRYNEWDEVCVLVSDGIVGWHDPNNFIIIDEHL